MPTSIDTALRDPVDSQALKAALKAESDQVDSISSSGTIATISFLSDVDQAVADAVKAIYDAWPILDETPDNEIYRIYDLCVDEVQKWPHTMVDFCHHTRGDIALDKSTFLQPNKRPDYALYKWQGTDIARFRWTFVNIPDSTFMLSRTEEIAYYQNDGNLGPYFLKKSKTYDFAGNSHDQGEVLRERQTSRQKIMDDIKFISIVTMQAGFPTETTEQIYNRGGALWAKYNQEIAAYIEVASTSFADAIAAEADAEFNWLNFAVPNGGGILLRGYMGLQLAIE